MKPLPKWIGVLAIGFYIAHAAELILRFPWINLLWSCNVAAALVCIALLLRLRATNAIGCFMLGLGNIFWVIDLSTGGEFLPTSPLTHIGMLGLSLWGVRVMGLPRHTWWSTLIAMFFVTVVSSWVGDPGENVNLAHKIPDGYEAFFPSHGIYLLCNLLLLAAVGLVAQVVLLHFGFARAGRPWPTWQSAKDMNSGDASASAVDATTASQQPPRASSTPRRSTGDASEHPLVQQYAQHINPTFIKLLGTLGYGRLLVRARDVWIWDHEGQQYIDCLAGYGSVNIGHNHPRLTARLKEFLDENALNFVHVGPAPQLGELGARLASVIDEPLNVVIPTNTGAEAVESGIKLARAATGRAGIVYCTGSYHGSSLGTLSVMGHERIRKPLEPLLPHCVEVPFGGLDALEHALAQQPIAGFLVDPGLCEAGRVFPAPGYLKEAQALCRKHGALLILDEIQTGLGRLGTLFAYQTEDVVPDVLVLAKSLSGGIAPIGAAVTTEDIHQRACGTFESFDAHSTTFGGNAFSCTAALETLDILRDEGLVENCRERGSELLEGVRERLCGHPLVREIRGRGLMIAIHLGLDEDGWLAKVTPNDAQKGSNDVFGQWAAVRLLERGLLCQPATQHWNILKLMPPLTIQDTEVAAVVELVGEVFDEYQGAGSVMAAVSSRLGKQFLAGWAF